MNDLASTLLVLLRSNKGSTFFLNGSPGAGKSQALRDAAQMLAEQHSDCLVVGPLSPLNLEWLEVCELTLQSLENKGYLENVPTEIPELVELWQWLAEHNHFNRKKIMVIVDLPPTDPQDLSKACTFFSQARFIEAHNPWDGHVSYIICGSWDHVALYDVYETMYTSFPYTISHNYLLWNGIAEDEMITLCEKRLSGRPLANLIGRLIFEITGGNPAIAIALLNLMKAAPIYSVAELLRLLKSVVKTDPIADRFVAILKTFPPESFKYLGNLLNQKKFRQPMILPPYVERLQTAGLIHTELVGDSAYVSLRSWFIETLLRIRFAEIGIEAESAGIGLDKFIPHVTSISIEAFKVVNQIENLVRNFVAVQLWQAYLEGDPHPLSLRVIKNAESAYDRALNWKERNRQHNINSVILNPEIAYLSTGDLATLVKEIGVENDWNSWEQIGNQIENLQGIRNTVMHNQIIDLADLEKLYKLREHIYLALNE